MEHGPAPLLNAANRAVNAMKLDLTPALQRGLRALKVLRIFAGSTRYGVDIRGLSPNVQLRAN